MIRVMQQQDILPTAALMRHVWHHDYALFMNGAYADKRYDEKKSIEKQTATLIRSMESPDQHRAVVALDDAGDIAGFCYISINTPAHNIGEFIVEGFDCELQRFYLWPAARGKGTGRAMLRDFLPWFAAGAYKSCFAWSFDQNPSSGFYSAHGATGAKQVTYDYDGRQIGVTAFGWLDFAAVFKDNKIKG